MIANILIAWAIAAAALIYLVFAGITYRILESRIEDLEPELAAMAGVFWPLVGVGTVVWGLVLWLAWIAVAGADLLLGRKGASRHRPRV